MKKYNFFILLVFLLLLSNNVFAEKNILEEDIAKLYKDEINGFTLMISSKWSIDQQLTKPKDAVFTAYKQNREYTGTLYIFKEKDYFFDMEDTFSNLTPEKEQKIKDKVFEDMRRSPFENPSYDDIKIISIKDNYWLFSMTTMKNVKGVETITIRAKTLKNQVLYSILCVSSGNDDSALTELYSMMSSFEVL